MRLLAAYPVALKQHLRGQRNLAEFNEVLSATELDYLSRDENLPVAVCSMLTTNITPMIHPQAKLNAM
jgi:predicted membrane chloride channel (bestrophin family)